LLLLVWWDMPHERLDRPGERLLVAVEGIVIAVRRPWVLRFTW
jgi:hypothetical protein